MKSSRRRHRLVDRGRGRPVRPRDPRAAALGGRRPAAPARDTAGRRRYSQDDVVRIASIVRSKAAGMGLDQIARAPGLRGARTAPDPPGAHRRPRPPDGRDGARAQDGRARLRVPGARRRRVPRLPQARRRPRLRHRRDVPDWTPTVGPLHRLAACAPASRSCWSWPLLVPGAPATVTTVRAGREADGRDGGRRRSPPGLSSGDLARVPFDAATAEGAQASYDAVRRGDGRAAADRGRVDLGRPRGTRRHREGDARLDVDPRRAGASGPTAPSPT